MHHFGLWDESVSCERAAPVSLEWLRCRAWQTLNTRKNILMQTTSAVSQIKALKSYFTVFCVAMVVAIPLLIIPSAVFGHTDPLEPEKLAQPMVLNLAIMFIAVMVLLIGAISGLMLHYRLWKLIPKDIARTTPSKAVIFMFITFFNLYWAFISCWGLSKDMNRTLQQRDIQHQVSESLGLWVCILGIVSLICIQIPYVDILLTPLSFIVWIFFYKSVMNGAIALLQREEA